ncbi:hypothetical protein [Microcoleus sp. herbarium7]|uniref:hypothetical protein n=1 Tax=Microcoleus sp. herbarium7 TaxID=3055435 RepID=UPI002FD3CE02
MSFEGFQKPGFSKKPGFLETIFGKPEVRGRRTRSRSQLQPIAIAFKIENLRKSDNFKQICQIGNTALISPDIFR